MAEKIETDLIVIGGGINGAAIARDAALRGIKVLLLEKDDFGSGASTKTSKLAHGGVRYLEQGHFGLVRSSVKERTLLLKNAPHLVKPLPFIMPVFKGGPYSVWQLNLGLYIYDYIAGKGSLQPHRKLSEEEISQAFPGIFQKDLRGGCLYYDALMQDNRIVIENILAAELAGAITLNYSPVTQFIEVNGQVVGVDFYNAKTNSPARALGKVIINATGAWTDQVITLSGDQSNCVSPSKGVHLVLPQISKEVALLLRAPQDDRVFFIIPWNGYSLVGTTDTFYHGNPDLVDVDNDDRTYLLEALNFYFPEMNIDKTSVIAEFAGLRPLVSNGQHMSSWKVERDYSIKCSTNGLISIFGGKFTTHRQMAEKAVDKAAQKLNMDKIGKCSTTCTPLPGAISNLKLEEIRSRLSTLGIQQACIDHLIDTYGGLSEHIIPFILPNELTPFCQHHPHLLAEIEYAIRFEHARTPSDWLLRRTSIGYTTCRNCECVDLVAKKFTQVNNNF